jgi:hypothetical protein
MAKRAFSKNGNKSWMAEAKYIFINQKCLTKYFIKYFCSMCNSRFKQIFRAAEKSPSTVLCRGWGSGGCTAHNTKSAMD